MQFINSIVSTGTQYIDTGFKPNQNTRVVMDVEITSISSFGAFFGARSAASTTADLLYLAGASGTADSVRSDYFGGSVSLSLNPVGLRIIIDKNKNVCSFNGETVTNTAATGQLSISLFLLAANTAGSATSFIKARLHSCQIYDNVVLVRDLWPCIDDNGVVCMYDKANIAYYYNAGTGEFEAGFPPVFFKRRPLVSAEPDPISVTITGTGHSTYARAVINGTTYTAAASGIEVMPGDVITLHVALKRSGQISSVTIDGKTVAIVTTYGGTTDYEWTVPEGITSATIAFKYASYVGTITVTTS